MVGWGSLRCVSAAEHHTAEQYSKTGKTKPQKHLPMSNLSWNTNHRAFQCHLETVIKVKMNYRIRKKNAASMTIK